MSAGVVNHRWLVGPGAWARDPQRACVQPGVNPDVFFPSVGDRGAIATARAICAGCPVKWECRAYALSVGEDHGVWGALTPTDRRQIRKARRLEEA